jgi:signal transduction histidine kinase
MSRKGVSDQSKLIKKLNKKTRELKRNEEELMTINSTKDKLFSIIGHDLRSPIAALQDLLKLFKEGDIPEKDLLDYIPKLHKDVDHIWFTLNNLLSWSRSQMNGATTSPKEIDLGELASENINFLSEIAENKEIGFINQLPNDTMAWADADHINVVFRNLFSNALKFTKAGGTITAGIQSFENYWKISVADTGVGMDEATQDKIFQKDHTYTTYGTNNEKGTGLGLSLCKDMIQKNKGSIWVESEVGVGSTFYFMVPKSRMQLQQAI